MITVSTRDYEMSHGKKPRGRGSWAFFFDGNQDVTNRAFIFWSAGNTTYGDAKAFARIGGHYNIEVGS